MKHLNPSEEAALYAKIRTLLPKHLMFECIDCGWTYDEEPNKCSSPKCRCSRFEEYNLTEDKQLGLADVLITLKPIPEIGLYLGSDNLYITRAKKPAPRGSLNKFDSVMYDLSIPTLEAQSPELKFLLHSILFQK